eukprot:358375-Chlamydomonas_euryale.AAC.11
MPAWLWPYWTRTPASTMSAWLWHDPTHLHPAAAWRTKTASREHLWQRWPSVHSRGPTAQR